MPNSEKNSHDDTRTTNMSNTPEIIEPPESKRLRFFLEPVLTVALMGLGFHLLKRALVEGELRYFMPLEVGAMIIMTGVLAYKHFAHLVRESKNKNQNAVAKKKLQAEVYAGIALSAFLLVWGRSGIELDRRNTDARYGHFERARAILVSELSPNRCGSVKSGPPLCKDVLDSANSIFWALVDPRKNESQVKSAIEAVNLKLESLHTMFPDVNLAEVRQELKSTLVDDNEFLFPSLYIQAILMAAAAFTVSRKISIAAFELATKQTPQGKEVSFVTTLLQAFSPAKRRRTSNSRTM